MVSNNRFLQDHFNLSWLGTVRAHNMLVDGLIDFEQKTAFVLSLANSIEIGIKQILIDMRSIELFSQRWLETSEEGNRVRQDLSNESHTLGYNSTLFNHKNTAFKTITLKEAIKKLKSEICTNFYNDFSSWDAFMIAVDALTNARNDAIHFHISENDYLNDFSDFSSMRQLLLLFERLFSVQNIIQKRSWGQVPPSHSDQRYIISEIPISISSYEDIIKESYAMKHILEKIDGAEIDEGFSADTYGISFALFEGYAGVDFDGDMKFEEFYRRICILIKHNLLQVQRNANLSKGSLLLKSNP